MNLSVYLLPFTLALVLIQPTPAPVQVRVDTDLGSFVVELDPRAPQTVANFLKYVDGGFYDGGRFHRTVRPDTETRPDVPIEVIQAAMRADRAGEAWGPIPLERTSVTGIKHLDGTISMARSSNADSARDEFFISIGDQPLLDFGGKRARDGQGYAAFGRVVTGMDVVRKIHQAPAQRQSLTPPIGIVRAVRVRK